MILCDVEMATLPPTINHLWKKTRGGRLYKSSEGRRWQETCAALIKSCAGGETYKEPVRCLYVFTSKDKRRWDVDNRIKAMQDCLMMSGVIEDDSQILEFTAKREFGKADYTRVRVETLDL